MKTLAVDASSNVTGWAIMDNDKLIAFGEITLKKLPPFDRFVTLYNVLSEIVLEHCPTNCIVEATFLRNVKTIQALERIRGVVILAMVQNGISDIAELNASTVRKRVFGNGALDKDVACERLSNHFAVSLKSKGYDQSDAVALACASHSLIVK